MRLLLIRHGQTIDNARGALGTAAPGPGLTELGDRQAQALQSALAAEPIDAIYASTLIRTQLTAGPLARARGLEVQILDGLQEISAGSLEQHSDEESVKSYVGTVASWWSDLAARIPDGENGHEFQARYDGAIRRIAAQRYGTVAVVSHGAAIRAWACWNATNLDAEFSLTHPLANTGVVVVDGAPDAGWIASAWAGEPLGGPELETINPDPTGDPMVGSDSQR